VRISGTVYLSCLPDPCGSDPEIAEKLAAFKKEMADKVTRKAKNPCMKM
jgi:hypothetical protein